MRRGEYSLRTPVRKRGLAVEFQLHELVHVPPDQDVAVEQHHPLVFLEGERDEFRPCLGESGVLRVLARDGGIHVRDPLNWDPAGLEYFQAFGGEAGGIEGYEGVARGVRWGCSGEIIVGGSAGVRARVI